MIVLTNRGATPIIKTQATGKEAIRGVAPQHYTPTTSFQNPVWTFRIRGSKPRRQMKMPKDNGNTNDWLDTKKNYNWKKLGRVASTKKKEHELLGIIYQYTSNPRIRMRRSKWGKGRRRRRWRWRNSSRSRCVWRGCKGTRDERKKRRVAMVNPGWKRERPVGGEGEGMGSYMRLSRFESGWRSERVKNITPSHTDDDSRVKQALPDANNSTKERCLFVCENKTYISIFVQCFAMTL